MPRPKKPPLTDVLPTKLIPAPDNFAPKTGIRGQVLGRALTAISASSPGMVEVMDLDGHFVKQSSGFYVEATTPFSSKIDPGTGVVMSTDFVIEAILPNFQTGQNP